MPVIRLAKMGGTSHLKNDRPGRKGFKEKTKPGIFNVTDNRCWMIGSKNTEVTYPNRYDPVIRGFNSNGRK